MQKVTGKAAEEHYKRRDEEGEYQLTPEFNRMSLKPGIGAKWLDKYENDVYINDHVIVNGISCTPPKYYDKLLKRRNPERLEELKNERELDGLKYRHDNTEDRLRVKEIVAKAKTKALLRNKL